MNNPLNSNSISTPQPVLSHQAGDNCNSCCEVEGEGGVKTFIELTDVPQSYAGQGGKFVAVKSDASGLEFVDNTASGWRPVRIIGRDDPKWTDDHTYTDTTLAGTTFLVYYNGNKFLTEPGEGFQILSGGGFTYDPAKFQFYDGEFLYMIF